MSKLIQKILIILALPMVGALVLYQIDSELLDPSSDRSLFAIVFTVKKAQDISGQMDLSGSNSPSQLLGMIWNTFSISDSLLFPPRKKDVRDPMKPLTALGADAQLAIRKTIKPNRPAVFPIRGSDISAIFWNPSTPARSLVLIRGKRYTIGSEVKGATITAINQSSVVFTWRNKT